MKFEEELSVVMNALVSGFESQTIDEKQEVLKKLIEVHDKNPSDFLDTLEIAKVKFNFLITTAMGIPETEESLILEHIISGLYEYFHETRIEKIEGFSCSGDKSSFIKQMTLKALRGSENLSLYMDYTNVEQIKEGKEKQAYWSPKSIKDTDEAMQLFWDWYCSV